MRIDLIVLIRVVVVLLYLREERCLIILTVFDSSVFNFQVWVFQVYLLLIVSPSILRELELGTFVSPVRILAEQLCFLHM